MIDWLIGSFMDSLRIPFFYDTKNVSLNLCAEFYDSRLSVGVASFKKERDSFVHCSYIPRF